MYLFIASFFLNILYAITEEVREIIYSTKADTIGIAVLMQGYAAREGFGITLIRNQTVDAIPRKRKEILKESFPGSTFDNCFLLRIKSLEMLISNNLDY
ncbi:hypothetical protein ES705_49833 [subsurface metagenome]